METTENPGPAAAPVGSEGPPGEAKSEAHVEITRMAVVSEETSDSLKPTAPAEVPAARTMPLPSEDGKASLDDDTSVSAVRKYHRRRNSGLVPFLVNVALVVLGVIIGFFGRPFVAPPAAAPAASGDQATILNFLLAQTRHFRGNANAPVTIFEFSDFQ